MGSPVTHWQIISKDPDGAAGFYEELFGWKVDTDNGLNYRMVDTQSDGRGVPGGIWRGPTPWRKRAWPMKICRSSASGTVTG